MTTARPRITAALAAELMDAAPGRVRRRIDADPSAADAWPWQCVGDHWQITAGDETVTLQPRDADLLQRVEEVRCSCLLAPRCFHLLACITRLTLGVADDAPQLPQLPQAPSAEATSDIGDSDTLESGNRRGTPAESSAATGGEDAAVDVTAAIRGAAQDVLQALERLLIVGCRSAGVVVQSSLLRASHRCRAQQLVNLASAIVRVVEGIQRLRTQDEHTDARQLRRDIIAAASLATELTRRDQVPLEMIGQTRRKFAPAAISQLVGLIAEPIWTLSGYAGVCVHLRANDGRWYSIVEARPGEIDAVQQAYVGGIDLGGVAVPASRLSRGRVSVQNATASADGRLGKGAQTRWAVAPANSSGQATAAEEALARPLRGQLEAVLDRASSTASTQRGGWDLVVAEGAILGAQGARVLLQCDGVAAPLHLGIAIDDERLNFRRNLQCLARCPGLPVRVLARVRVEIAGRIDPLTLIAMSPAPATARQETSRLATGHQATGRSEAGCESTGDAPRLVLPEPWGDRCHLGLDELQRHHFTSAERFAQEVPLASDDPTGSNSDLTHTEALERALTAHLLGGRNGGPPVTSASHRRQCDRLRQRYQSTAAALLDLLAISAARSATAVGTDRARRLPLCSVAAAIEIYCDAAKQSGYRDRWRPWLDDPA